jgi:hypothetical protein
MDPPIKPTPAMMSEDSVVINGPTMLTKSACHLTCTHQVSMSDDQSYLQSSQSSSQCSGHRGSGMRAG